ncbi:MAG: integrase arm-type DNA-binding domain-containing protein [Alphaproteobacteria bacterium]|nr:integrase arm-type DNA-binding domain-containing protein [Alphaproteobacteria bacterium]
MNLTDVKVRNAKPKDKPYKFSDSGGLHILIKPNGTKTWILRYFFMTKEKSLTIGPYPLYSLAEAREKRDTVRKLVREGIDPAEQKRERLAAKLQAKANTFEAVVRRWHEVRRGTAIHKQRSMRRLELYVLPKLGSRPTRMQISNPVTESIVNVEGLPIGAQRTLSDWLRGADIRAYMNRQTLYRHKKQILERTGIDISTTPLTDPPTINLKELLITNFQPEPIPDWAIASRLVVLP